MRGQLRVRAVELRVVQVRLVDPGAQVVRVLFPAPLCGQPRRVTEDQWLTRLSRPHNDQSDESQSSRAWSELQIGRRWAPAEVVAGSVFRSASILAFVVISA